MLPLLSSHLDFSAPTPVVVAIVIIVIGLLLVRFVVKSAITLVKIAILVAIGIAAYLAVVWIKAQFG